jgi:flagellar basal-body rod protein FlgG
MLRSFTTIRNGIERAMDSNDVIANNMANINTIGFKQSKILFKDIREVEIQKLQCKQEFDPMNTDNRTAGKLSLGPEVSKMMIDFSQGDFLTTGNKLDFAINGEGFFTVQGQNNEELYTRKGNFTIDPKGFLATIDGQRVINRDTNAPLKIEAENKRPEDILVTQDGTVTFGREKIGVLKIAEFKDKTNLIPVEGAAFKNSKPAVAPNIMRTPNVMQGSLETSNANSITTMLKSLEALRSYESMAGAMQTTSDTLQKVVNQVGRF